LGLPREPAAGPAAKREIECVDELASARFDLLDLADVWVGTRIDSGQAGIGRKDGRVGIAGAEALDLDGISIGGSDGDGLVDLVLDAEAGLDGVGSADVGGKANDAGGNGS
jgi:hypothetical protein